MHYTLIVCHISALFTFIISIHQPQALGLHLRIHHNDRRFKCKMCSRRFIQRQVMLTHLAVHTGERPFECKVCGRAYRQRATLRNHIISKHGKDVGGNIQQCQICGRNFALKQTLRRHVRLIHHTTLVR
ncbi:hypothetical protein AAMO2058_001155700 [Amorphochlora amoebiformis]